MNSVPNKASPWLDRLYSAPLTLLPIFVIFTGCYANLSTMNRATKSTLDRAEFSPSSTFVYSDSVRINYESIGVGPRAALFLHGFAASLRNWDDIRPMLSKGLRLYFLDLKGFGFSSKPRSSDYGVAEQAAIVQAFVAAQGLPHVTLVGHSYGGAVALLTYLRWSLSAAANPIDRLLLIDSGGYSQRLPLFIDSLRVPFASYLLPLIPRRAQVRYSLQHAFYNHSLITNRLIDRYAFFYGLEGAQESFVQAANQVVPPDQDVIEKRFSTIPIPVLVLWGREDRIVPFSHGLRFEHELKAGRLVPIESCGHVPQEERPEVTARLISEFLEGS